MSLLGFLLLLLLLLSMSVGGRLSRKGDGEASAGRQSKAASDD